MIQTNLLWQDNYTVNNDSIFEVLAPRRNTSQKLKDFVNDQDAVYGPGIIDNIIRNVLSIRSGSLTADDFGFTADMILFDQLNWATLEILKTIFQSDIAKSLPEGTQVDNIDLRITDDNAGIEVSVLYYQADDKIRNEDPVTIGNKIARFTLTK